MQSIVEPSTPGNPRVRETGGDHFDRGGPDLIRGRDGNSSGLRHQLRVFRGSFRGLHPARTAKYGIYHADLRCQEAHHPERETSPECHPNDDYFLCLHVCVSFTR